jgi:hypothetical protein
VWGWPGRRGRAGLDSACRVKRASAASQSRASAQARDPLGPAIPSPYVLFSSPTTLPCGSENWAKVTMFGISVTGTTVLPPAFSIRSR